MKKKISCYTCKYECHLYNQGLTWCEFGNNMDSKNCKDYKEIEKGEFKSSSTSI